MRTFTLAMTGMGLMGDFTINGLRYDHGRNGRPPDPREAGLKDVVLTHPGERVELRLSFADYADPASPYMMHCHILEHEDAGMIQQFTVV